MKSFRNIGFHKTPTYWWSSRQQCEAWMLHSKFSLLKKPCSSPVFSRAELPVKEMSLHWLVFGNSVFTVNTLTTFYSETKLNCVSLQLQLQRSQIWVFHYSRLLNCLIIWSFILEKDWHHMAKMNTGSYVCFVYHKQYTRKIFTLHFSLMS